MHYRSPYKAESAHYHLLPRGLLWDRDWWYLVGQRLDQGEEVRLWRADRVLRMTEGLTQTDTVWEFDVNTVLGRTWLQSAIQQWSAESPVKIRLTRRQADLLQRDWYYRFAQFEDLPNDQVFMTFGEDNPQMVVDLIRWLGPGAELIEPQAWRALLRGELAAMLAVYR